MTKLIILMFCILTLQFTGCKKLDEYRGREGIPNRSGKPQSKIKSITIWADFDLDDCCARISQIKGLMFLPDFFYIRDLPRDGNLRFIQIEILDFNRGLQIVSVCYEGSRDDNNFIYSHTLLEYGDCNDDIAWIRDQSTLDVQIEKSDTIRVTGLGDFDGVKNQFVINVATN